MKSSLMIEKGMWFKLVISISGAVKFIFLCFYSNLMDFSSANMSKVDHPQLLWFLSLIWEHIAVACSFSFPILFNYYKVC